MSRLDIKTASKAQTVVDRLYKDMERRIASSPPGLCPIDMSLTFLQLCHAQSCGKCVPCRIGLGQLAALMGQVLDGTGTMLTIDTIEKTARAIVASADCAIGRDAAQLVLSGFEGFRDDYVNHVQHHRCLASLQNPVPCVSLCPAGVDVPGYVALVREGRYADLVQPLINRGTPNSSLVLREGFLDVLNTLRCSKNTGNVDMFRIALGEESLHTHLHADTCGKHRVGNDEHLIRKIRCG